MEYTKLRFTLSGRLSEPNTSFHLLVLRNPNAVVPRGGQASSMGEVGPMPVWPVTFDTRNTTVL